MTNQPAQPDSMHTANTEIRIRAEGVPHGG